MNNKMFARVDGVDRGSSKKVCVIEVLVVLCLAYFSLLVSSAEDYFEMGAVAYPRGISQWWHTGLNDIYLIFPFCTLSGVQRKAGRTLD